MPTFNFWEVSDNPIADNIKKRKRKYQIETDQIVVEFILWCMEFSIEHLNNIDEIEDGVSLKKEFLDSLWEKEGDK